MGAGMGRSQGTKYGMRGVAAMLGFLLGFSSKNVTDRVRSGNTMGFPLAKKYVRTLNVERATGRRDANRHFGSYNWQGPGAKKPDVSVLMMDTKAKRNARRARVALIEEYGSLSAAKRIFARRNANA